MCLTSTDDTTRSSKAKREASALRLLNERGCEHVPTLLSTFEDFESEPEGRRSEHFILMTKVPGVTLWSQYHLLSEDEQTKIRAAFRIALKAVRDCGVDNGSAHLGNVIWCKEEDKWYVPLSRRNENCCVLLLITCTKQLHHRLRARQVRPSGIPQLDAVRLGHAQRLNASCRLGQVLLHLILKLCWGKLTAGTQNCLAGFYFAIVVFDEVEAEAEAMSQAEPN